MNKKIVSMAAVLLAAAAVFAGIRLGDMHLAAAQENVDTVFTYQGKLLRSGEAVNGISCDMQFSLFDASSGGTQFGDTLTISDIAITDGYFIVNLDFGDQFNGDKRYLQVALSCPPDAKGSYTTLDERVDLSATPYAIYAQTATSAVSATNAGTALVATTATTAQNVSKITWSSILNRPTGLDNGDDDTLPSVCPVGAAYRGRVPKSDGAGSWLCRVDEDSDTLESLSTQCITTEIAVYNGAAWECGTDQNTLYSAGTGLDLANFVFSLQEPYRLPTGCTTNQVAKWDNTNSEWDCAADNSAEYTAGQGINATSLTTYKIEVAVSGIAGDGLADDGSNKLKVDTSAIIGDGLAVDASNNIKVDASAIAGTGLTADASNNLNVSASELAGFGLNATTGNKLDVNISGIISDGLTTSANTILVNAGAIAGDGLEDDGSNNLQIETGGVGMRELSIPMGSAQSSSFTAFGAGDEVDEFPVTGVSIPANGSCLVIATGVIKSEGSATSNPHGYVRAAKKVGSSTSAEPSTAMTYFADIDKMDSATVSWVFDVSAGDSVSFGCRINVPTGSDWGGDEYYGCSVSYMCQ